MAEEDELKSRVEDLIKALRAHAAAMAANEDGGAAMPVINEVRRAALAYNDVVFEATGWGNVFADLHTDIANPLRRRRVRRRG